MLLLLNPVERKCEAELYVQASGCGRWGSSEQWLLAQVPAPAPAPAFAKIPDTALQNFTLFKPFLYRKPPSSHPREPTQTRLLLAHFQMLIIQDLQSNRKYWQSQTTGPRGRYNIPPGVIVMKFGEQLRTSVIKEYEFYYIAYDELKDLLKTDYLKPPQKGKPKPKRKEWTESNERDFIDRMETELDKVYTKQKVKLIEIGRRIAASQKEVADVVARLDSRGPVGRDGQEHNNDAPTEDEFMMLEEDLSDIIADVHDLAKFVQLNYTGFQKIIKKHDVGAKQRL